VGESFVGFELLRELGRGGFARVYLAREAALGDRTVVVKVSPSGTTEALTLGRLAHPNIVPVFSVRADARTKRSAVCMPYLGEATLADVLARVKARPALPRHAHVILDAARGGSAAGPLPDVPRAPASERLLQQGSYVEGIRHLAVQLLDALDFMHREGVFHLDL
jgi:serine/threonine protein kinase